MLSGGIETEADLPFFLTLPFSPLISLSCWPLGCRFPRGIPGGQELYSREEGDGKSMNNKTSSLQREPQARTGSAVRHTDFTNASEMYLLNGWFIMISLVDSEFVEINTKSKDKVAWNKAKLKGLNKRREISSIFKITLYLWQTNDQMDCLASGETGSIAWVKYTIRKSKVPFLKRCSDKVRALSIWGDFFLFLEGRLIKTKGH